MKRTFIFDLMQCLVNCAITGKVNDELANHYNILKDFSQQHHILKKLEESISMCILGDFSCIYEAYLLTEAIFLSINEKNSSVEIPKLNFSKIQELSHTFCMVQNSKNFQTISTDLTEINNHHILPSIIKLLAVEDDEISGFYRKHLEKNSNKVFELVLNNLNIQDSSMLAKQCVLFVCNTNPTHIFFHEIVFNGSDLLKEIIIPYLLTYNEFHLLQKLAVELKCKNANRKAVLALSSNYCNVDFLINLCKTDNHAFMALSKFNPEILMSLEKEFRGNHAKYEYILYALCEHADKNDEIFDFLKKLFALLKKDEAFQNNIVVALCENNSNLIFLENNINKIKFVRPVINLAYNHYSQEHFYDLYSTFASNKNVYLSLREYIFHKTNLDSRWCDFFASHNDGLMTAITICLDKPAAINLLREFDYSAGIQLVFRIYPIELMKIGVFDFWDDYCYKLCEFLQYSLIYKGTIDNWFYSECFSEILAICPDITIPALELLDFDEINEIISNVLNLVNVQ